MPELPDVELYVDHLARRVRGLPLDAVRLPSPSLLRTVDPPPGSAVGRNVTGVERMGKRVVLGFDGELYFVIHLMIAGRLRWKKRGAAVPRRLGHAAFDFPNGTLLLTEAGTKKRASLHVVSGSDALRALDPGGLEVIDGEFAPFAERLRRGNHTLKRALTDPRLVSGIGNAYSDEILHAARLSPVTLTSRLSDEEARRLWEATRETLRAWCGRLRAETGDAFPEKVTAFREGMAVHGRYRKPCPDCGAPVQRIVYASNETNYCAGCQTGGKLLADRALSRLLKKDWPRSPEELEARLAGNGS
jgi:formamidopyrimidine-DNA glycosylase